MKNTKNFKKILILLLVFGFVTLACGIGGDDSDESKKKDERNQEQEEDKMSLTGRVWYFGGDFSFTLEHEDEHYVIFISGDEDISTGDYVMVTGTWDDDNDALVSESLQKLSAEEKTQYFQEFFPFLEVSILEYSKEVGHTCFTPKFKLNVTNTGEETISHEDLHTYDYEFGFFYFINEDWSRANGDRENYTDALTNDNKELIGLLSNQGFTFFEDIKPGESREIEYWAGGQVTKTDAGTAGSPNIFGNKDVGEHSVSFAWANKNNYDPIFLSRSQEVDVKLLSDRCDLGL